MDTLNHIIEFLKQNTKAFEIYQSLPPSHKSECVRWVEEAKQEKTKIRRMEKMVSMLLENRK
ncbi:YdeI/OmpD-associated family protein [Rhodocaloribacter sp.]